MIRLHTSILFVAVLIGTGCGGNPIQLAPRVTSSQPITTSSSQPTAVSSASVVSARRNLTQAAAASQSAVMMRPTRAARRPDGTNPPPTYPSIAGNWDFTATSSVYGTDSYIEGYLTNTGPAVSGTVFVVWSECFLESVPLAVTGTVNAAGNVNITTAAYANQVISASITIANGTASNGSYTITGGCSDGDHGTAFGYTVANGSGYWSGSITDSTSATRAVSASLVQASLPNSNGWYAVTGTITISDTICFPSGVPITVSNGRIAGGFIWFDVIYGSSTLNGMGFMYDGTATRMVIAYSIVSGVCYGDTGNGSLSR